MSSAAVAPSPAHVQEPDVTGSSIVPTVRGSTAEPHSRLSLPFQHVQEQTRLPDGLEPPFSQLHQRRHGQQGRQRYVREGPPPLLDAKGQVCWIVAYIMGHEDPHHKVTSTAQKMRAVPSASGIVYGGSGFQPSKIHDSRVPRFFVRFQMSFEHTSLWSPCILTRPRI